MHGTCTHETDITMQTANTSPYSLDLCMPTDPKKTIFILLVCCYCGSLSLFRSCCSPLSFMILFRMQSKSRRTAILLCSCTAHRHTCTHSRIPLPCFNLFNGRRRRRLWRLAPIFVGAFSELMTFNQNGVYTSSSSTSTWIAFSHIFGFFIDIEWREQSVLSSISFVSFCNKSIWFYSVQTRVWFSVWFASFACKWSREKNKIPVKKKNSPFGQLIFIAKMRARKKAHWNLPSTFFSTDAPCCRVILLLFFLTNH